MPKNLRRIFYSTNSEHAIAAIALPLTSWPSFLKNRGHNYCWNVDSIILNGKHGVLKRRCARVHNVLLYCYLLCRSNRRVINNNDVLISIGLIVTVKFYKIQYYYLFPVITHNIMGIRQLDTYWWGRLLSSSSCTADLDFTILL